MNKSKFFQVQFLTFLDSPQEDVHELCNKKKGWGAKSLGKNNVIYLHPESAL